MAEQLAQIATNVPFTMLWAHRSREFNLVEGEYDDATQKWSLTDVAAATTWSRSSTTGIVYDDPDEDKDD
ncbi:MAG: hypothetical protein ACREEM_06525 [Blastocatellia bacterium]